MSVGWSSFSLLTRRVENKGNSNAVQHTAMPPEATAVPPHPRLQVSSSSDLRVLRVHPIPPAPFTLSLGFGPCSSPILEMQRLRPTEDTQVTNSSLMPLPDMGLLAHSSFSLPPRVPQKYLLSIYMLLTESPNHSVRSVIYEAEVEWEQPFQAPDSRRLAWSPFCPTPKPVLPLSFTLAQISSSSAPPTFITTCGVIQDLDVTATELFPSSPALTNL